MNNSETFKQDSTISSLLINYLIKIEVHTQIMIQSDKLESLDEIELRNLQLEGIMNSLEQLFIITDKTK